MTTPSDYWNARAATYDTLRWVNNTELLRWCVDRATVFARRPAWVQEIGCGTGALTEALALALPGSLREFVATDVSEEMIGRARDRFLRPTCTANPPRFVTTPTGMVYPPSDPDWIAPPRVPVHAFPHDAEWGSAWVAPDGVVFELDETTWTDRDGNAFDLDGVRRPYPSRPRLPGWDLVVSRMVLHHAPVTERDAQPIDAPARLVRDWFDLVAPGGSLAICEGVPPVPGPHASTDLFRAAMDLKEPGRHVFYAHDIARWVSAAGAAEVAVFDTWTSGNSVRNWAMNGGADPDTADRLLAMHRDAVRKDPTVAEAYDAVITTTDDVLMRWRHCVVVGRRGPVT